MGKTWSGGGRWCRSNWEVKGQFNKVYLSDFSAPNSTSLVDIFPHPGTGRGPFRERGPLGKKGEATFLLLLLSQTPSVLDLQWAKMPHFGMACLKPHQEKIPCFCLEAAGHEPATLQKAVFLCIRKKRIGKLCGEARGREDWTGAWGVCIYWGWLIVGHAV